MRGQTPCRLPHVARQKPLGCPRSRPGEEPYNAEHSRRRHTKVVIVLQQETTALLSHAEISYIAGRLYRPLQRGQNQNPWTELIPIGETYHEIHKSRNRGLRCRKEAIVEWRQLEAADLGQRANRTLSSGFPRKLSICYSAILAIPQPSGDRVPLLRWAMCAGSGRSGLQ